MSKESEFRKLLKKADQEYFSKRNKPIKITAPFIYEMDAIDLTGDHLTWLN